MPNVIIYYVKPRLVLGRDTAWWTMLLCYMPSQTKSYSLTKSIYMSPLSTSKRLTIPLIIKFWFIDWSLTPFLTFSQSYHGGQFTYSYVSWFSFTSTHTTIFLSNWLLFQTDLAHLSSSFVFNTQKKRFEGIL